MMRAWKRPSSCLTQFRGMSSRSAVRSRDSRTIWLDFFIRSGCNAFSQDDERLFWSVPAGTDAGRQRVYRLRAQRDDRLAERARPANGAGGRRGTDRDVVVI